PFKYKLVEAIQNRLARENQVEAGDEMLAAFESAFYLNRKVALIDMDTREILMRIHQNMSLKENVRFLFSILAGMIKTKKDVTDELFKYESDYSTYMSEFEKKFPVLKRELIDNRNKHMAENILNLAKEYNHVLAVVGEGHIEGIKELLLKTIPSEALRIKHLFDFEEFRKLLGERK
ncbi:MAG TPA: hypothetical protein EYP29_05615, partial [Thermoplasmata archaeon]|nr:hypothetical protein [Thermoplasmata archaeon]